MARSRPPEDDDANLSLKVDRPTAPTVDRPARDPLRTRRQRTGHDPGVRPAGAPSSPGKTRRNRHVGGRVAPGATDRRRRLSGNRHVGRLVRACDGGGAPGELPEAQHHIPAAPARHSRFRPGDGPVRRDRGGRSLPRRRVARRRYHGRGKAADVSVRRALGRARETHPRE